MGQDFLHLGGCESTHCPGADVAQHIRGQQDAGSRLIVGGVENADLIVMAKCPIIRQSKTILGLILARDWRFNSFPRADSLLKTRRGTRTVRLIRVCRCVGIR